MKLISQLLDLLSFYSEKPEQREFAFVRAVTMVLMVTSPLMLLLSIEYLDWFDQIVVVAITVLCTTIFLLNRFVESFRKVAIYFLYSVLYLLVGYLLYNAHDHNYSYNSAFQVTLAFFSLLLIMRKQAQVVIFSSIFVVLLIISLLVIDETLISKGFLISFIVAYVLISVLVMNYRIKLRDRLEADQDFLSALFNNSFDAVFLVEFYSGKIEDCNAVAVKMFEVETKQDLIGNGRGAYRKVPMTAEDRREMQLTISRNGQFRQEVEYVSVKGREFWADLIVYPLSIRNSQYWVYRVVDITDRKQALSLVLRRDQEYTSLIDNMNEGVMRFDPDHRITFVNDRMLQLLGRNKETIVDQLAVDVLAADSESREELLRQQVREREGISTKLTLPVITSDNRQLWTDYSTTALYSEAGTITGYLCFIRDITQRKSDQEALAASEADFRSLAKNAPVLIFKVNRSGIVLFVNWLPPEYVEDKVINHPLTNFIDERFQSLFEESLEQVFQSGESIDFDLKASGRDYKMVWYSMRLSRVQEGDEQHAIAIVSDIQKLKRIQEALSISEDTYREIFNTTSDLMYIHSRDGSYMDVNQAVLDFYGYEKEEIVGRKPIDFADGTEHDAKELESNIKRAWKGNTVKFVYHHKHLKSAEITIKEVTLRKGNYFGEAAIIASVRDITDQIRHEMALKSSEEKFRLLFSTANDAIFILQKGKLMDCNERAYDMFLAKPEDFLGQSPAVLFPSKQLNGRDSLELANEYIRRAQEGDHQNFPWLHQKQDGTQFNTEVSLSVFSTQEGSYVQAIVRDVSMRMEAQREQIRAELAEATAAELQKEIRERERAEVLLMEQQRFARAIINSSLDMIVAADRDGNITEFNTAAQKIFGYTFEEVIGKPVKLLYAGEDERSSVFQKLLVAQGTYTGEINNLRKNGEEFSTYISASILRREDGEVIGSMGVSRDITELKEQQEELRQNETRYRALYNQAFIGIARMSIDGKFVQVNQRLCTILGYSEEELKNFTLSDITHPDYIKKTANLKRHFVDDDDSIADKITFEKKFIHKDQSEIDANLTIASVVDADGIPDYFVTVFEDITERKRAEEEVKASLHEKEVLLKEVHHRVKNNLQVISSILNLQSSYVKDEGTLEILRESQNRIKSMSFIHENLYQTSDLSEIDFSDYVSNLSTNLLHSYQIHQGRVKLVQDVEQVMLNLDQAIPCGLILNEIVTNAFKYAFPDKREGEVRIVLREIEGMITLTMGDNGIGLPEGFDYENSETLGLQLVTILTDQLSATMDIELSAGTNYTLAFRKVSRNFKTGKFIEHGKS